jgi:Ribonuclease G/E
MLIDEIFISALPGDRRAAARHRGSLVRLIFDSDANELRCGDVRLGRIKALAPAIGGAFVDIGATRPGLLMREDAPRGRPLAEGEVLSVQVARLPEGDKGAKLDARLPEGKPPPPGLAAPCLIRRGSDPIADLLRSAVGPELRSATVDDAATLTALRKAVPEAEAVLGLWRGDGPLFPAEGLEEEIEAIFSPQVPLPSGGRLVIEETAATVAIDVDSAAMPGASARAVALACNLEAAAEIGRQIQLRELAGLIVVDFVPLRRQAERERVLTTLRNAFAGGDRRLRIGGWTRLGLVEIVRERRGPSLLRQLGARCVACDGVGIVRDPRWVAGQALRAALAGSRGINLGGSALIVSPPVAAMLRGPLATALHDVEARIGCPIALRENTSLPPDDFVFEAPDVRR